jgi:hypothetical protein
VRGKDKKRKFLYNQVINTPTLTLPPQGGGGFFLIPMCLPSPLVGEGRVRGKDKKGNSYTIELLVRR